jgi:23S rRNA G2445 N2-methylase RlmL
MYKLNIARDVDSDEPGVYILNLPKGFRFDEHSSPNDRLHVRGYDTMKELRADIKHSVIPCDCNGCK